MNIQDMEPVDQIEEPVEALTANTVATIQNTQATIKGGSVDLGRNTAIICSLLIAATCLMGVTNKDFASNQGGLILSTLAGGLLGFTQQNLRR